MIVISSFWHATREKLRGRHQVFGCGEKTLKRTFVMRCADHATYYWINLEDRVKDEVKRMICQKKTKR